MTDLAPPPPSHAPPPPASQAAPWHQRPIAIGLLLAFIPLIGGLLLLIHPRWSWTRKLLILGLVSLFWMPTMLGAMASSSQPTSRPVATARR